MKLNAGNAIQTRRDPLATHPEGFEGNNWGGITVTGIEPSSEEKQSVYEEILHENHIRRNAQLPRYDLQEEYAARLARLNQKKYRELMMPYLAECLAELPKSMGLVQRLGTQMKAEQCAARRLFEDTGIEPVVGALPSWTDRMMSSLIR